MAQAAKEGDYLMMAGMPNQDDPGNLERDATATGYGHTSVEDTHVAFGKFVNLMRRRRGLTIEQFATEMQIDAGEVLAIEEDVHYAPEPRTVYRFALSFKLPQERLMQIAGLAETRDPSLRSQAVRFAASADPVRHLSSEETSALEAFVEVLSERGPSKR